MKLDPKRMRAFRNAAALSSIGLTLVFATAIGVGMGYLLDQWLHTGGWMTILFTVLGIVAGFVEMIRAVIRSSKDEDRDPD